MRILVTGSTGFVGSNLIPKLVENNQILEITRNLEKSERLFGTSTEKYLLNDKQDELVDKVKKFNPQIVIHLAAKLGSSCEYTETIKFLDANIYFLTRILDSIKDCNVSLFINTGTFAEKYNNVELSSPAYFYAATKTASRSLVDYYSQLCSFKQLTIVPFTVYGKSDTNKKIIDLIIDSLNSSSSIPLTQGNQILDFIHIDDVVEGYLKAIDKLEFLPNKSNIELGTGKGYSLREVADLLERISSKKANISWGAIQYRPLDPMCSIAKKSEINDVTGWDAKIPLEKGLKLYLKAN